MRASTTIAEAVAILASSPKAVLCLDTCDFLDVVRSFEEDGNRQSAMFRRLADHLTSDANRIQLAITHLVRHEWGQNVGGSANRASEHLQDTADRIERVMKCCEHVEIVPEPSGADLGRLPLVSGLVDLAERVMDRAMVLEKDESCVQRALSRVMDRRRPSHKGAIKDSIHLEHYLELSRHLGQARYPEVCLFVSGNKADFWEGPPRIHRDLEVEFQSSGLQFFGKLDAALGRLGI